MYRRGGDGAGSRTPRKLADHRPVEADHGSVRVGERTSHRSPMRRGEPPPAAGSYADVGGRFVVSRTHARELLLAAERAGLVRLHAAGGRRVEILPRLW